MKRLQLDERYPEAKINSPAVSDWGWLITFVTDPSGVLLHFAEPHSEENEAFFNNADWMRNGP